MTFLVTGASGFIGLNLLAHLLAAHPGARIIAADLYSPTPGDCAALGTAARSIRYQRLDVCDPIACEYLLARRRPTYVIHGAAVTSNSSTACKVNVEGTRNLLEASVAAGSVKRFLFLSSSAVYGCLEDSIACTEDHPLQLEHPYARSKRDAELLMASAEARGGFPVLAARIGPAYGPFERPRETRPRISLIGHLQALLAEGRALQVGGSDYTRDWTHAADIASALNALLFTSTLNHRLYNVSSGIPISARAIIASFERSGLKVCWKTDATQADLLLSPSEARKPLVIDRLRHDTAFIPQHRL